MDTIDKNLEGCTKILASRIKAIFNSPMTIVLSFKILNVLQFYSAVISKVIGPSAQLSHHLREYLLTQQGYRTWLLFLSKMH
jgi:Conserved oligomeric complex COG6